MDEDKNKRRPRVLLGITGSVAAVKGPELAVKLLRDLQVDVRVLLTRGGSNFWNKAREYDPLHWDELEKFLCSDPQCSTEGTIIIHSEYTLLDIWSWFFSSLILSNTVVSLFAFVSCGRRVARMASSG
jgi:hypothetical protein